ncbi:Centriolar coiled-coil protein, partial [Ophiophagus hannah]
MAQEIEEQARRLKEEKNATESGIPAINLGSGVALEWRKITDTNLLESVLNRVEAAHSTNLENEGFVNAGSPFYLWEQPASGKSVVVSRSISRSKMRWSQASERMSILRQDREIRKEKMLRQLVRCGRPSLTVLDKAKSPKDKVTLSTATQKSLDRKKYIKYVAETSPSAQPRSKRSYPKAAVQTREYLPEESQERSQMLRQPKKAAFPWLGSGLAIVLQRSPYVPSGNAGR